MNIARIATAALLVGMMALASATLSAQPLSKKARGAKTVKLSDKVGKNQFTWNSDAPLEKIQGTADGVTGTLTLDPTNVATIRGTISTQVATFKSGNNMRDEHIRGASWLDAAQFPTITFAITSVSNVTVAGNKATGKATGNFTMHGVTKQLTVPFTLTYIDESAVSRKRAPGDLISITAEFNVSLKDYNVAGSRGTIGSKVGEMISVKAQLFGSTGL